MTHRGKGGRLTAYMAIPEVTSVKNNRPTFLLDKIFQGIIGFCQGNFSDSSFPGAIRLSQQMNRPIKTTPTAKETITAAEFQAYVAPPQVKARMTNAKPTRKRTCPPMSMVFIRAANLVRRPVSAVSSSSGIGCGPKSSFRKTK